MEQEIQDQFNRINEFMDNHQHIGYDATRIDFKNIYRKKIYLTHTIAGTGAATAANYGTFYIVPVNCVFNGFKEVHRGNSSGNGTLMLEKLTGTQAPDAGVSMLATTIDLTAALNTIQTATLTTTLANRSLVAGDRLCLKDAGTLTNCKNVVVLVELILI